MLPILLIVEELERILVDQGFETLFSLPTTFVQL